jgi:hypothetical protein
MRSPFLTLTIPLILAACGDSLSSPPNDASTDQKVADDASNADASGSDASTKDSSTADSSSVDSSVPYEAGSLDMCNPNDPSSCSKGLKCCSEPTHKQPPSAFICVTPLNGVCPQLP